MHKMGWLLSPKNILSIDCAHSTVFSELTWSFNGLCSLLCLKKSLRVLSIIYLKYS